ncbi:COG1361 family protein [Rubripirellula reticaptiva]|nr:DUF11 domain-containing protein [Rubripirellula reticaptiva]
MIAIPALLLMISLTHGASPNDAVGSADSPGKNVKLAVAQSTAGGNLGQVQQVAGKQLQRGDTRPGLLGRLAGGSSNSSQATKPNTQSSQSPQPRGLLDTLFSRESSTKTSAAPAPTQNQADVNWDGIPFHKASPGSVAKAPAPIRDPKSAPASTATRVIRGTATRSVPTQARTVSSRKGDAPTMESAPTVARRSTANPAIPKPPAETAITSTNDSLSGDSSSRRSGRRDVETYTAPAPTRRALQSTATATSSLVNDDSVVDLVPRVSRKAIPATETKPDAAKTIAKTTTTAATPAPAAAPIAKPEAAEPAVAKTPIVEKTEVAKTEIAMPAPKSVAVTPSATLSAPTAVPTPSYTTPVDPATTPVPPSPAATVPSQPYMASSPVEAMAPVPMATIPAATVSHRAGPPVTAFAPPAPASTSIGMPATSYGTRSTAIGSGVANDNFGSAQMTRPYVSPPSQTAGSNLSAPSSSTPTFQTARATPDPFDDPYGRRDGRLNTTTPSYGARALAPATAAATSVPMHAIDGYQANAPEQNLAADDDQFNRSNTDVRNQMRSAVSQGSTALGAGMASSELPGIRVVTRGPKEVTIRQTNEYEIRVENRGAIDAEGLIVRAMIPDWAEVRGQNVTHGEVESQGEGTVERLVWTIQQLPAGTSETLFVRLNAARSGTHDVDVDWTLMPQKSVAQINVHEPRLDLTIEGPQEVVYGESQTYKVRVLNPGDGVAPNVVFTLSPNSATPQTQRIGDIPAGKEAQFDVELTAQDLGDLKIHGLAMGDLDLRAEAAKTIRVSAAQIEAVLNGPELKYQNTEAMYNLQLQNVGSATTQNVVATLRLPAGAKYLGGIEGAQLRANTLRWEIATLAPGAQRDYQFRCNMTATGEHVFAFDCKGTAAGFADVALTTRVESISDLVLTINDPIAPAPIGTEVTYEVIVRNRGSREAKDVKALAQFSHGIEPKRVEGQSGEIVTGQVLFDSIPRIAAGEEIRMKIIAIADRAGHHRFRTEVRSGDTVLVAEEATHYMSPQSDRVSRRSSDNKQIR